VPGEVAGKTGTAEFGGGNPPETHAWFVAYRGDLALAVLVEKGRSGASVAAPLAARFFSAYGA
jgi:cell division protein FtsI/penicillin-binding protein 2